MLFVLVYTSLSAMTVKVHSLASAPELDGQTKDWSSISSTNIPVSGVIDVSNIAIKMGTHANKVYLLLEWSDSTNDDQHKPFVWDAKKKKYVAGPQREDRLAIQFGMTGDYDANWFSGKTYTADMWHWKAGRSNPIGYVHDKMTVITTDPVKRAYKAKAENGKTIYIQRPGDKGSKLYKTKRYSKKEKDMMPKYILTKNPSGSIADIKAKGVWANGKWTLELERAMNTGNPDDVVFQKGKAVKGAIAVFNRSGDEKHNISETLTFQF